MKIIKVTNQAEGGAIAFTLLKEALKNGAKTLGLATGSSPLSFYQKLVTSDLDFSQMVSINLDEYVGLSANNDQSYHYFMNEHLFKYKSFKTSYLPDGLSENSVQAAENYDQIIADNPIDFQILGIGRNGHIGFNEPGTSFDSKTHVVDLATSTIEANARFFDSIDEVPRQAISMGIASIMSAKQIVLMAYGSEKAEAIYKTVHGVMTEDVPASALQKHENVILVLDEAAASLLEDN